MRQSAFANLGDSEYRSAASDPNEDNRDPTVEAADINIYMSAFFGGGAEMSMARLANYWTVSGQRLVRFVVNVPEGPIVEHLDPRIEIVNLEERRTRHAIPRLRSWVKQREPRLLVSVLPTANIAAAMAIGLGSRRTAHAALVRNFTSAEFAHKSAIRGKLASLALRAALRSADAVGCVSGSVAKDIKTFTGLPDERIWTTYNPVPTPGESTGTVPGWPAEPDRVLVAAGRLVPQKDYPTLLRALALARSELKIDLVILGDGPLRSELEQLAGELNISKHVHFLGYVKNTLDYVRKCDVFILTSRFEGFPNVLAEALALGRTAIATDAPGGSAEILGGGRYGYLAPVGDFEAIARLIVRALREPIDPARARKRASEFETAKIALRYEEAFNGAIQHRHERLGRAKR